MKSKKEIKSQIKIRYTNNFLEYQGRFCKLSYVPRPFFTSTKKKRKTRVSVFEISTSFTFLVHLLFRLPWLFKPANHETIVRDLVGIPAEVISEIASRLLITSAGR